MWYSSGDALEERESDWIFCPYIVCFFYLPQSGTLQVGCARVGRKQDQTKGKQVTVVLVTVLIGQLDRSFDCCHTRRKEASCVAALLSISKDVRTTRKE